MPEDEKERSPEEIARRRDETIKRMIATPPEPQKDLPKKRAKKVKRQKAKA